MELKLETYMINGRHRIQMREVQSLIFWVLGDVVAPKWVFVKVHTHSIHACPFIALTAFNRTHGLTLCIHQHIHVHRMNLFDLRTVFIHKHCTHASHSQNKPLVSKVVVCMVDGLTLEMCQR